MFLCFQLQVRTAQCLLEFLFYIYFNRNIKFAFKTEEESNYNTGNN